MSCPAPTIGKNSCMYTAAGEIVCDNSGIVDGAMLILKGKAQTIETFWGGAPGGCAACSANAIPKPPPLPPTGR